MKGRMKYLGFEPTITEMAIEETDDYKDQCHFCHCRVDKCRCTDESIETTIYGTDSTLNY